jgi:hypothetical protein
MRAYALITLAALLVAGGWNVVHYFGPDAPSGPSHLARRAFLRRRATPKTLSQELLTSSAVWAISVGLGPSGPPLIISLDTGSADTWLNSATSQLCQSEAGCTRNGGAFNPQASTPVGQPFQYTYIDGTQAAGDYVRATLRFGGQTLENFQFAVGASSRPLFNRLGLGYPAAQAIALAGGDPYPTIYDLLISKGLITTKSFSIWLDDPDSGRILFGGVNTAKYSGELVTVPIQPIDGVFKEFAIVLRGIGLSAEGQSISLPSSGTDLPVNVVLNSGSVFTFLPPGVVDELYLGIQVVGTLARDGARTAFVDCEVVQSGVTVDFNFGSVTISVPISALVFSFEVYRQLSPNGLEVCAVKVRPSTDGKNVLGLSFFETAYLVFDLTNNQISMAPAVRGVTEDKIIEVGQDPNAPVDAVPEPSAEDFPGLEGYTLVDEADYATLSDGVFIPYDVYIATKDNAEVAGQGDPGASPSDEHNSGADGEFVDVDPSILDQIDPSQLISYEEFMASIGAPITPNPPIPGGEPAGSEGTPDGAVPPPEVPLASTPPETQVPVVVDPATAVAPVTVQPETIDPLTGLPITGSTVVVINDDPLIDPLINPLADPFFNDPFLDDPFF